MASAAQHKLTVQLTAQVDAAYKSALEQARTAVADLKAQIDSLRDTANQVSAYEKAQTELTALTSKLEALKQQYTETETKMQSATGNTTSWNSALAALQKQINTTQVKIAEQTTRLEAAKQKLEAAGVSTDNLTGSEQQLRTEYDRLSAELKENEAALESLEAEKKQAIANAEAEAEAIIKEQEAQEENTKATEEAAEGTSSFGDKLATVAEGALLTFGKYLTEWVIEKLKEIPELFEECVEAAIEFESAITGVAKTTDFSDEELEAYAEALQDLATVIPESTTELAAVSETAGQLGIASEDILEFTEVMAMLGTATNMTSDTAATYLAQMANITQMDASYYENLGSAIVYLGNNYATTEEKIVQMSQRIAAAASIAGMTEAEITGISAAVGSLGVQAMVGGTTITSVITDITTAVATGSDDLETYAWAAGMTVREFTAAWEEDAASAFAAVVTGLADTERLGVSSTTEALREIGITEDRATRVMLSLANSGDLLTEAIADANTAWEENTALVTEAELRYGTTESQLQLLENAWSNLKTTIGEYFTPVLGDLAGAAADVLIWITDLIDGTETLEEEFTQLILEGEDFTEGSALAENFAAQVDVYTDSVSRYEAAVDRLSAAKERSDSMTGTGESGEDTSGTAVSSFLGDYTTYADLDELMNAYNELSDALSSGITAGGIDISGLTTESEVARQEYIKEFLLVASEALSALSGEELTFSDLSGFDNYVNNAEELFDLLTGSGLSALESAVTMLNYGLTDEDTIEGIFYDAFISYGYSAEEAGELASDAMNNVRDAIYGVEEATDDATDALDDYDREIGMLDPAVQGFAENHELMETAASDLALAVLNGAMSYEDAAAAALEYGDSMGSAEYMVKAFNDAMDETVLAAIDVEESISEITDALQDAIDEWEGYYDTAASAVGLFDDMTPEEPDEDEEVTTADDLLTALKSQASYYETYLENIEKLQSMGLNNGILSELLSGTSSDSEYLEILADSSQETVDEINAAWEESETAKDNFATTLADMQTDLDTTMQEIVDSSEEAIEQMNLSAEAASAAYETMQAYIEELEAGGSEAYTTALYYANLIANALSGNTLTYETVTDTGAVLEGYGHHATGGIFSQEHLAWVAEDGPEAIIPLTDTARGLAIWEQAGRMLGVPSTTANSSYVSESYAPAINITVNGNANSDTVLDIKRAVQQALKEQERTLKRTRYA